MIRQIIIVGDSSEADAAYSNLCRDFPARDFGRRIIHLEDAPFALYRGSDIVFVNLREGNALHDVVIEMARRSRDVMVFETPKAYRLGEGKMLAHYADPTPEYLGKVYG